MTDPSPKDTVLAQIADAVHNALPRHDGQRCGSAGCDRAAEAVRSVVAPVLEQQATMLAQLREALRESRTDARVADDDLHAWEELAATRRVRAETAEAKSAHLRAELGARTTTVAQLRAAHLDAVGERDREKERAATYEQAYTAACKTDEVIDAQFDLMTQMRDSEREINEELRKERDKLREAVKAYEDGLTWQTTCTGCAGLTNKLYDADMRRELAEEERDRFKDTLTRHEDLLASIVLHINWRWVTRKLTTEQKELFAEALEREAIRAHGPDGDDPDPELMVLPAYAPRWWRDDYQSEGPQPVELAGLDPNITGGLPAEEYLRRMRSGTLDQPEGATDV